MESEEWLDGAYSERTSAHVKEKLWGTMAKQKGI